MTETNLEMWWPPPEAFNDLEVTDIEEGWQLSAPDDTELAEWLNYWSQDEEHHVLFEKAFLEVLINHANSILDQNGETEVQSDEQSGNRTEAEDDGTGSVS